MNVHEIALSNGEKWYTAGARDTLALAQTMGLESPRKEPGKRNIEDEQDLQYVYPTAWAAVHGEPETHNGRLLRVFPGSVTYISPVPEHQLVGIVDYDEDAQSMTPNGRCDTCGAPCNDSGCTVDSFHEAAIA